MYSALCMRWSLYKQKKFASHSFPAEVAYNLWSIF